MRPDFVQPWGMPNYAASDYPVSESLEATHDAALASLVDSGSWWSGEDRRAIAEVARSSRAAAGLQSGPVDATGGLATHVVELASKLAVSPRELELADFESFTKGGSVGEYVETVGVVAVVTNLDIFSRGIGLPPAPLAAGDGRAPTAALPKAAREEGAWVPTVPCGIRGGEEGRSLYGEGMQPFIYRALSIAPKDAATNMALGDAQYLPIDRFAEYAYSHHPALSRPQVELVAGRVSAVNECFY